MVFLWCAAEVLEAELLAGLACRRRAHHSAVQTHDLVHVLVLERLPQRVHQVVGLHVPVEDVQDADQIGQFELLLL